MAAKPFLPENPLAQTAIAVVILIIVLKVIFPDWDSDSRAKPVPPVEETPYVTNAQALFSDYQDNEVAADERMKGRPVIVSGTVIEIRKDFSDSVVIALETKNPYMSAMMTLEDSQKDQAIHLYKGGTVKVKCQKMSRIIGSPMGSKCLLAN